MEYVLITNKEEILPYIHAITCSKILAVDTETTGLNPHADRIRLIQIAAEGLPSFIVDCFTFLPNGAETVKDILEGPNIKIFQNAKFDLQFFMALDIHPSPVFDTMLANQLLRTSGGSERSNLAALAHHYLNEDISKDEQKSNWQGVLSESQLMYAARDAEVLLRLRKAMVRELYGNALSRVAQIEFSCVHAIAEMEYTGISLDIESWKQLIIQTEKKGTRRWTFCIRIQESPLYR